MVTTDTITSTTAVFSNVSVIMNPLAPSTPVNVANTGMSTSATMLTASDHDRASRMMIAPASTTGTEQASAHPAISHRSVGTSRAPQVAATPDRLHPMLIAELGPQPLDMHSHGGQIPEVPAPHQLQQLLAGEHGVGVGQEEQQQVELAVGQRNRLSGNGHRPRRGRHGQIA